MLLRGVWAGLRASIYTNFVLKIHLLHRQNGRNKLSHFPDATSSSKKEMLKNMLYS